MRRILFALFAASALASLTALGGCPAAHNDYPNTACMTDNDCFKGEHCMNGTVCVVDPSDMAVELPDLGHLTGDLSGVPPDDLSGADLAQVDL